MRRERQLLPYGQAPHFPVPALSPFINNSSGNSDAYRHVSAQSNGGENGNLYGSSSSNAAALSPKSNNPNTLMICQQQGAMLTQLMVAFQQQASLVTTLQRQVNMLYMQQQQQQFNGLSSAPSTGNQQQAPPSAKNNIVFNNALVGRQPLLTPSALNLHQHQQQQGSMNPVTGTFSSFYAKQQPSPAAGLAVFSNNRKEEQPAVKKKASAINNSISPLNTSAIDPATAHNTAAPPKRKRSAPSSAPTIITKKALAAASREAPISNSQRLFTTQPGQGSLGRMMMGRGGDGANSPTTAFLLDAIFQDPGPDHETMHSNETSDNLGADSPPPLMSNPGNQHLMPINGSSNNNNVVDPLHQFIVDDEMFASIAAAVASSESPKNSLSATYTPIDDNNPIMAFYMPNEEYPSAAKNISSLAAPHPSTKPLIMHPIDKNDNSRNKSGTSENDADIQNLLMMNSVSPSPMSYLNMDRHLSNASSQTTNHFHHGM